MSLSIIPQQLPECVDPEMAEEMFDFADKDKDNKIGWEEFQVGGHISYRHFLSSIVKYWQVLSSFVK